MEKGRVAGVNWLSIVVLSSCHLLIVTAVAAAAQYSPGVISGTILDSSSRQPLAGAVVTAYDSDAGRSDELIGRATTNGSGKYSIRIPKRTKRNQWDGPKTDHHTQWRPDIYIVVDKEEYKRFKSKVYSDHKLKNNLSINGQMAPLPGARTVRGTIYQQDGRTPLAGAIVTACDADTGGDQVMGSATTDASGRYQIAYAAGSWDGPKTDRHTQWRPDIFVVVTKDGAKRTKSQTFSDHKLAEPLTVNVKVEAKPGKIHSIRKNMCEPESPAARCKEQGDDYIWLGPENKLGRCTKLRNEVMAVKNTMQAAKPQVWAYVAYFEAVGSGAEKRSLPGDVRQQLQAYYPAKVLNEVRYASSKLTAGGNAMTDCSTIYFPAEQGLGAVATIKNGRLFNADATSTRHLHWLLHELEHANQCSNWGGRMLYADRWFSQLPAPVLQDVFDNLDKANMGRIHDSMPMEKQAEGKADSVMAQLTLSAQKAIVPPSVRRVDSLRIPERRLPSSRQLR
jgi:hypothetical protein